MIAKGTVRFACVVTVVGWGCATPSPRPSVSSPLAPILGCWKAVDGKVSGSSFKVGTVVCFSAEDVVVYNDDVEWARMDMVWDAPVPPHFTGALMGGPLLLNLGANGRVDVTEGGTLLGIVERLPSNEMTTLPEKLSAIPQVSAARDRYVACLAAFHQALPGATTFQRAAAAQSIHTTASFRSLTEIAEIELAQKCLPLPEVCRGYPPSARTAQKLSDAERQCKGGGPATVSDQKDAAGKSAAP